MQTDIYQAISTAVSALGVPEAKFVVEYPTDAHTTADYFTNAALVLAKPLGTSPRAVAEQLLAVLPEKIPGVARVEIAGPGFINFYLTRESFTATLAAARTAGAAWGKNDSHASAEILLEYTSPNLFKPLHIGNLVGNIIGEALTRLFEMSGATVHRLNYPSDIGPTVAKAVWGLQKTGGNPNDINALGEAYRVGNEAFETDEVAKVEIDAVNQKLYAQSDPELSALRQQGIATSKARLAAICAQLGTQFDAEIPESEAGPIGVEIVRAHIGEVFSESDGAIVYEGERVGLHTRVFLNSKGLPTYEAKDLGNFVRKQTLYPAWTHSIIVTGGEQTEYFKVLYAAIRDIFPSASERVLEHIPTGFLTLTTGKMSSRKGNVLTGESLLEEMESAAVEKAQETRAEDIEVLAEQVAVAALKYQILRQSVGSNIVFDKEKSLSFEGDSGPYLQYTHARAQSVLERATEKGIVPSLEQTPPEVYEVERLLTRFPGVIETALAERAPHQVAQYLTALAGAFNSFYATEKIADATDEFAPYKAAVADAVRLTLKNGLWALGIKAPERM